MKAAFTAICSKSSLADIRKFMEEELGTMKVSADVTHQIVLAVDEACANSIIHQHHCDGTTEIAIKLSRTGNQLQIDILDKGDPFPIDEVQPDSDMDSMIRRRSKGGLGLILISKIMDKVEVIKGDREFIYRFTKFI